MPRKIYINGTDLVSLAKKAYELSAPRGMGFLHATPGPLSTEQAEGLVEDCRNSRFEALRMDYVNGRCVKLFVQREQNSDLIYITDPWYDHTEEDLQELMTAEGFVVYDPAASTTATPA